MSKTRTIKTDSDAMVMMTQRDIIPITCAYETVKPTPSSMDDPS